MNLDKNISLKLTQKNDESGGDNKRIKDVEWQEYNANVKKIKIKNLELEKVKNLQISITRETKNNEDAIEIKFNGVSKDVDINLDVRNGNNIIQKNDKDSFVDNNDIDIIKKEKIKGIQYENIKNNDIKKNHIKNNKEVVDDNMKNFVDDSYDIIRGSKNKDKKKDTNDNGLNTTQQPVKVFASQVKSPLDWIVMDNKYLQQDMDAMFLRLASYVISSVFGVAFGIFLTSTGTFATLGTAVIIYCATPKPLVIGFINFFQKITGAPYPIIKYTNLTDCLVNYSKQAPKRVQNKIKSKEAKIKNELRRQQEVQEKIKERNKELDCIIKNLCQIDKKGPTPKIIKLNNNLNTNNNITNNKTMEWKKSIKTIDNKDINKIIENIVKNGKNEQNDDKWINKVNTNVQSNLGKSLLLEKSIYNN